MNAKPPLHYVSTRGQAEPLGFDDVLLAGLAPDGGLFVPETWPQFSNDDWRALRGRPYVDAAFAILKPFAAAMGEAELKSDIAAAYATFGVSEVAPLRALPHLGADLHLLELFHGPTLAFKDVALQLLGRLMDRELSRRNARAVVVGATSGDTGSAAIHALKGRANVEVFILYPHGRVSDVQRRQMTTVSDGNVHALAVEGTFDDCQAIVKALFADTPFRDEVGLAAVNSINWARIAAQIVYYATAALALGAPEKKISFAVPTGNFGDIYAGYAAKRMGLPVGRLIIATNVNDILARTLETGRYEVRGVTATSSPSMDIQVSSNFERLLFELGGRDAALIARLMRDLKEKGAFELPASMLARLREDFTAFRADEGEVAAMIAEVQKKEGILIDPHTAVGLVAARKAGAGGAPLVALATAHAAKFPDAVTKAAGRAPELPEALKPMMTAPERFSVVEARTESVKWFIQDHLGMPL